MKGDASSRETFQATVLIPPGTDMAPFKTAIQTAMREKWDTDDMSTLGFKPVKKCEEKANLAGYEPGWFYINAHSGYAPTLVDHKRQPILDADILYGGCMCRFHLQAYAWEKAGRKGVSFSVEAVQKVGEGEPFVSRREASDIFDVVTLDGADETTPGAAFDSDGDAAALFE